MPFLDAFKIRYGNNGEEYVGDALDALYQKLGDISGTVETFADLPVSADTGDLYYVKTSTGTRWLLTFKKAGFYMWTGSAWDKAEKYIKWSQITSQVESLWQNATTGGASLYAILTVINYNGSLYLNLTGVNTDTAPNSDTTNWRLIASLIQQYVIVAKSGGQFSTIQGAIDSITDSASDKRYLIKIYPGIYTENLDFTGKNYIDIEGAGEVTSILNGTIILNQNHTIRKFGIQRTITTNETIIDAYTNSGGNLELYNVTIVIQSDTVGVKPTILKVDKNSLTCDILQINYTHTPSDIVGSETVLVDLNGTGNYIATTSLFSLFTSQTAGDVKYIKDNNAGFTALGLCKHIGFFNNGSWDDNYSFFEQTNDSATRHVINSLDADVVGSGLGNVKLISNNSGGAKSRVISSKLFVNNFTEKCIANAENVGDIIDMSFCEKNEEITDAEAFCGDGETKIFMRNDGEVILKDTDLVDLDILIGTPANRSLQDMFDIGFNAGWVSGQEITDNLDGTVTISSGTGYVRTSDDEQAPLKSFDIVAFEDISLTDESENYIYVDFNSNDPIVAVTTAGSSILDNENDQYEIYEVYREGTDLHITDHRQRAKNVGSRVQQRIYSINKIERANSVGGLILSESADNNRNVLVSAGLLWVKLNPIEIDALDTSGTDTFSSYYLTGVTTWNKIADVTTWDNIYYNDTTTGLVEMVVNRYSFKDYWLEADNDLIEVYGTDQYVSLAGASDAPVVLAPPQTDDHAIYIGRIVFRKSDTIAQAVLTPFGDILFTSSVVSVHNNLSGLQGGDVGEYYHLDAQDYTDISSNTQLAQLLTTGTPTFAGLNVDNLNLNGNTISSTTGDINITPVAGSQIVLDETIEVDGETFTNNLAGGGFTFNCERDGSSPEGAFVITKGLSGVSYNKDAYNLIIDSASGVSAINFLTSNTGLQGLVFGDTDDDNIATLLYSHSANRLSFNYAGNNYLNIESDGNVLKPFQANFEAYKNANSTNVTGDGTQVKVTFGVEWSDIGGNYNTADGRYTAPVSAYHNFTGSVRMIITSITSSHTAGLTYLNTSNKLLYGNYDDPYASGRRVYVSTWNSIWMDAGDTAQIDLVVFGGTKVIGINGSASLYFTYFTGGLKD